jgi:hypothetical protein
MFVVLSKVLL